MSLAQILFILVLAVVALLSLRLYGRIWSNIRLGKAIETEGDRVQRWKKVLLVAFGQKIMFKRWIPAVLHLFIYVAFLFTQIELIEILIDGLFGTHRIFAVHLGVLYTFIINLIEILSVLALVATVAFLWRRNAMRVKRFGQAEMSGWPKRDANLILVGEIVLITGIFTMNGADVILQDIDPVHYLDSGYLLISSWLGPALFGGLNEGMLVVLERLGWWLHILVVFGFLLYLPISKHLHILLAFPNTYYARLTAPGKMSNMPEIMREVKSMMGLEEEQAGIGMDDEIPEFGASDIFQLSRRHLLDAYTCTECGRCTDECPANITGKKLSPRKIMMNVRDRMEEVGKKLRSGDKQWMDNSENGNGTLKPDNFDDGKTLFDYITAEELNACTTCNACVEACPVLINPLDIILEMRRYEILTRGAGPDDWKPMFTSLENAGSVWQVNTERDNWIEGVKT